MRGLFKPSEVVVNYNPTGLEGRPCIEIELPQLPMVLRFSLEDAETLGEAMVSQVRLAEAPIEWSGGSGRKTWGDK